MNELRAKRRADYVSVCDAVEESSGAELGAQSDAVTKQYQDIEARNYRTVLAKLSATGRDEVERFAFEKVRPRTAVLDVTSFAAAAPDHYKSLCRDYKERAVVDSQERVPPSSESIVRPTLNNTENGLGYGEP